MGAASSKQQSDTLVLKPNVDLNLSETVLTQLDRNIDTDSIRHKKAEKYIAVSYTHLDVYKRQS